MSGDQIVVTITEPGMRETEGVLHAIDRLNKAMENHGRREMIVELCNVFGWDQPAHDDMDAWRKAIDHVDTLQRRVHGAEQNEIAMAEQLREAGRASATSAGDTRSMIEDLEGALGVERCDGDHNGPCQTRGDRWTVCITKAIELKDVGERLNTAHQEDIARALGTSHHGGWMDLCDKVQTAAQQSNEAYTAQHRLNVILGVLPGDLMLTWPQIVDQVARLTTGPAHTYALADRVRHVNGNAEPPVEGTIVEIIYGPGMAAPEYRVQWDGDPRYTRHAAKYLLPAPAREQTDDELSEPEDQSDQDTPASQDTPGVGGTVVADDLDGSGAISTDLIERARTWWFDREEPLARTSPDRPRSPRWPRDPHSPATPPGAPVEALAGVQGDRDHLIGHDQAFAAVQFALQMVESGAKLDGCEVVARARHALGMDS